MRKVDYRYVTVHADEHDPDIIVAVYTPKLEIDFPIAQELIENRLAFSEGKSIYTLIDFTNVKSVTKEARDYMNSPEGGLKGILAGAFLSNNVVATLFINLFLKISKPPVPARFFTDREEAINWLRRIKLIKSGHN
jgi:hypothetical protein